MRLHDMIGGEKSVTYDFLLFAADQALPKDEILDIAEFSIPAMWQKLMVLQGFDPESYGK